MAQSKRINEHLIGRLFPKSTFRLVPLSAEDARRKSDNLQILRQLLLENEAMYPSIDRWYSSKVVPGLKTSERIAYIAYEGENPIASAVLKLGVHAKFCHLRINQDFQDLDLGQLFFAQMALEARHGGARDIHFTLPEGLWERRAPFFKSFGFTEALKAHRQYRSGEAELSCSASWTEVWKNSVPKLPYLMQRFSPGGYLSSGELLLSLQPRHAERIFAQEKRVEIRRKFSTKWKGCKAVVYGTKPLGALMGEVTLSNVTCGPPQQIWDLFGDRVACSQEEFGRYVGNSKEVYAVELSDVTPYISPVNLDQLSHLIDKDLRPPQSFLNVRGTEDSSWSVAISVAGLLHGKCAARSRRSSIDTNQSEA